MNYSTYRFTLDIHKTRSQVSIPVMYQDTWVQFFINLTDGGKPYTLEEVYKAVLFGKKADGTAFVNECEIIDNNTRIVYTFNEQTASCIGSVGCEIRLYSIDGKQLTTPSFTILVEERVIKDDEIIESEADLSAIDLMFERETAREASEVERQEAEDDRRAAELAREEAEAKRVEAESKRQEGPSAFLADAKAYTDEVAAGKVDKVTNKTGLYASLHGEQIILGFSQEPQAYAIAYRTAGGQLRVGDAVLEDAAVPLAQMNEALEKLPLQSELDTLKAKVANLEAGISPDMFTVDDTTAYVKTIPADAKPYAEITSIGGITQDFTSGELGETLYDVSELDTSDLYGIDIYPDGKITYNGGGVELYFRDFFPSAEVGREYVFDYDLQVYGHLGNGEITFWDSIPVNERFVMTEEQYNTNVFFSQNIYDYTGEGFGEPGETTFINISLREVLKELIDTPVTAIDVYGKNLYNGGFGGNQTTEVGGVLTMSKTSSSSETKTMDWNAPYPMQELRLSADVLEYNTSVRTYAKVTRQDGSVTSFTFCSAGSVGVKSATYIADANSKRVTSISLYFYGGKIGDSIKMKDILIQPLASPDDTTYAIYRNKTTFAIPAAVQALEGYGKTGYAIEWDEQGKAWWVTPNGRTDISAYFAEDNLIPVEGGGTITAVNEHGLAAPTTIIYQKRGT